ncbi:MAG: hypothetical protein WDZ76_00505 [Pseudohongiellaceae bacterium]
MSQTYSATESYTTADVEVVMRRVTADFVMIASSTGAITEERARNWAHDVELLAKKGYLNAVDITLLSNGVEQKATCYTVNPESGELTMSRPGGVLWPKVQNPDLRIVLSYTNSYDSSAREDMRNKLRISWRPTLVDTSHSSLKFNANRSYTSNGYGMQRKDFGL